MMLYFSLFFVLDCSPSRFIESLRACPPLQSGAHAVGSCDAALRGVHLRPEHRHRRHAGPREDLTAPPPSLRRMETTPLSSPPKESHGELRSQWTLKNGHAS